MLFPLQFPRAECRLPFCFPLCDREEFLWRYYAGFFISKMILLPYRSSWIRHPWGIAAVSTE